MIARAAIVDEARHWIGTRFHHGASKRGVGADCIGLIVGVARELGVPEATDFADYAPAQGYGREPDPVMIREACRQFLCECAIARAGDILLLRFNKDPQHFAIVTAPGYMIHAFAQARRVVEHRIDDGWRGRIVRAYSYRGIA